MRVIAVYWVLLVGFLPGVVMANEAGFARWLKDFETRALRAGISRATVQWVLRPMQFEEQVITLDRKQPEGKITFTQYTQNIVAKTRIEKGRALYKEHRVMLEKIAQHYGVPAKYILALWGIETNYGAFKGNTSTLNALATLAYEGRRAEFFEKELLVLLRLIDKGDIPPEVLKGSWAGAMGHSQFMPTSFENFAVDWNKNGRKDIWSELPDVFASIANYLKTEGWKNEQGWGVAVQTPRHKKLVYDDLYSPLVYEQVRENGILLRSGAKIAPFAGNAYVMHPGEPGEGSYLVYDNYHVLLKWNRSRYFATAVGLLADAIVRP